MDGTLLDSNGILNPEFFTVFKDLSSEDIMFEIGRASCRERV